MDKRLALAIILGFGTVATAQAQQATGTTTPSSVLGTGTPGAIGTAGTNSKTPGAEPAQTIPGGGIPMGAATQDTSKLPADSNEFEGGRRSNSR
jgi:hypothetical protein